MSPEAVEATMREWEAAVARLSEALAADDGSRERADVVILRFMFTFELAWKSFQKLGRFQGFDALSPRSAIRLAFQQGWIDEERLWLAMIEDRNLVAHTYAEAKARQVLANARVYSPLFQQGLARAQAVLSDSRQSES